MPLSAVELCATALVKIGARPIARVRGRRRRRPPARAGSTRSPATLCSACIPGRSRWPRRALAPSRGAPVADFAHAFALPADHLRTISVGIGGRSRGTRLPGAGPSRILVRCAGDRAELPASGAPRDELPAFFVPLLVTRLAAEFCIPLTEGSSRAMDLYRLAEAELRSARLIDSQQSTPQGLRGLHPDRGAPRMSRAFVTKTSFTAGELDPLLRGRLDLKAQEDGAARLRNVVVHPSGGVSRRPGLRLVAATARARCASSRSTGRWRRAPGIRRLPARRAARRRRRPVVTDTLWGPAEIAGPEHRALGRPPAALPSRACRPRS